MALREQLAEVETELGDIREVIQEALDEEFEEEYTVQEVQITPADQISVLIDLTGPGEA